MEFITDGLINKTAKLVIYENRKSDKYHRVG